MSPASRILPISPGRLEYACSISSIRFRNLSISSQSTASPPLAGSRSPVQLMLPVTPESFRKRCGERNSASTSPFNCPLFRARRRVGCRRFWQDSENLSLATRLFKERRRFTRDLSDKCLLFSYHLIHQRPVFAIV